MPLRDHFRSPLDDRYHWQGMYAMWPAMIVAGLRGKLPPEFFAEPWVQSGRSAEIDVSTYESDVYEVQIYDRRRRARLVAAVEIVSPSNKDRPESRRAFVAKCAGLLRERVSVIVVDVVTTRTANFYGELLEFLGQSDPRVGSEPLYCIACRMTKQDDKWRMEAWAQSLSLGTPLPTMPLWLADDLAIPLDLEKSYEESVSALGIA